MIPDDSFSSIVTAAYDRLSRAHVEKDAEAAAEVFATNTMVFPPGEPPIRSRAELVAWLNRWYDEVDIASIEFRIVEAGMLGDCGYDVSSYIINFEGMRQGSCEIGNHIVIWKRDEDCWKIAYDAAAYAERIRIDRA